MTSSCPPPSPAPNPGSSHRDRTQRCWKPPWDSRTDAHKVFPTSISHPIAPRGPTNVVARGSPQWVLQSCSGVFSVLAPKPLGTPWDSLSALILGQLHVILHPENKQRVQGSRARHSTDPSRSEQLAPPGAAPPQAQHHPPAPQT